MILNRLLLLSAAGLTLVAAPANAATYVFDVLYSGGGVAALASGSDDPLAVVLAAGDSYTYSLTAAGTGQWSTLASGSIFPFFALRGPFGESVSNFTIALLNNGSNVFSRSEVAAETCCGHLGTNTISFGAGLVFDQYRLTSTIASTQNTGPATSLLPWPGQAPEVYSPDFIAFSAAGAVPEPITWAMMLMGFGMVGAAMRARRQKVSVRFT